jgi:molybdopterin-guanine dinucleotide biosynthesis protein A
MNVDTRGGIPPVWGLVLAGGMSARMGADKGAIAYHGNTPQAVWACSLLREICGRAYVSARPAQRGRAPYLELPVLADIQGPAGPAMGLLSAWARFPSVAWLVLAVDMPDVTAPLLRGLRETRDTSALATAYRHADGTPEPLCAIWEPRARGALLPAEPEVSVSLRRALETGPARLMPAARPERLLSINAAAERESREPRG